MHSDGARGTAVRESFIIIILVDPFLPSGMATFFPLLADAAKSSYLLVPVNSADELPY